MTHLVIADCAEARISADALASGFKALATQGDPPRLVRVTRLDLEKGPRLNRFKTILGVGWHARPVLTRLAEEMDRPVDAVVELCGCGDHHLLGLGRSGIPCVRWVPAGANGRPDSLDVLAAREGARIAGGSVAYAQRVPGTEVVCVPLPEDEEEVEDPKGRKGIMERAVEDILRIFDEERSGKPIADASSQSS